jgi:hypothetical protein
VGEKKAGNMTQPRDSLPKASPHPEKRTQPHPHTGLDTRGLLSLATLLVSMGGLTVAMGGAAKLVIDVFDEGLQSSFDGLWAKLIALGLAYVFGWGVALASIRGFSNLVYSFIIRIYIGVCLVAVCALYIKIIQKLYVQQYDAMHFWAYVFMLLGGLAVLITLHLLIEGHDLRPYAIPLLIISVLQLFVIVFRYVFTTDSEPMRLWGDLIVFLMMISLSALMVMHLGMLSPLRDRIDGLFQANGNGNGHAKDSDPHWVR